MNTNLLERYLQQVRRYLPWKDREETIEELRSLILDQVESNGSTDPEQRMSDVLKELGHPREVATRYDDRPPLIPREIEPVLWMVVRIVAVVLPLVVLFANALRYVGTTIDFRFGDLMLAILTSIPEALYSGVLAIGMVFIVFALIGRFAGDEWTFTEREFDPAMLPELPTKSFRVSIVGSIVTTLILGLLIYVANVHLDLVAAYNEGVRVPVFNDAADPYIVLLSIGWGFSVLLQLYYLYRQEKTVLTKTIEYGLGLYGAIVLIVFGSADVYREIVINGTDLSIVTDVLRYALPIAGGVAILGSTVDYIEMMVQWRKLDAIHMSRKQ
jgi:hypothetical protein